MGFFNFDGFGVRFLVFGFVLCRCGIFLWWLLFVVL